MKTFHRNIIKKQAALMRRLIPTIKGPSKQDRRDHKFGIRYRPAALKGILDGMPDSKLSRLMRAVASDDRNYGGRVDISWYTSKRVILSALDKEYYADLRGADVFFHHNTEVIIAQFHR